MSSQEYTKNIVSKDNCRFLRTIKTLFLDFLDELQFTLSALLFLKIQNLKLNPATEPNTWCHLPKTERTRCSKCIMVATCRDW